MGGRAGGEGESHPSLGPKRAADDERGANLPPERGGRKWEQFNGRAPEMQLRPRERLWPL